MGTNHTLRDQSYDNKISTISGGSSNKDWAANVVVDPELITGQNPVSANDVATEILKML